MGEGVRGHRVLGFIDMGGGGGGGGGLQEG